MLNIAIAGLGTVGSGVARLLRRNAAIIENRAGRKIAIKAVSARMKTKKRGFDLSGIDWFDDPRDLTKLEGIDVVVELIGGADGMAREVAETTLKNGKHLVTANKALIAAHGVGLARLAEAHGRQLAFEAAVAGGVPVIKTIREALAGNRINLVRGILNGTCNYILTRMGDAGLSFADALREAQELGYAEGDPTSDIDGHDAANKLAILAALAFGGPPELGEVVVEGIRHITQADLNFAAELGCRIKLLGVARPGLKKPQLRVGPSLVPNRSPLAEVNGALNAVLIHGDYSGDLMLEGQGAGSEPTASAVVADLVDLASDRQFRGRFFEPFQLEPQPGREPEADPTTSRFYIRLQVMDKPGVVADIASILRDETISIASLLQHGKSDFDSVPLVITTHEADIGAMARAAEQFVQIRTVVEKPCILRMED